MKLYFMLFLYLFSIFSSGLCLTDETKGIDILGVNASIACSEEQPLIIEGDYGFITTLGFDGFHYYPSNINCSWILMAKQNHSFYISFRAFELDYYKRDGLYVYDGYNTSAPLINSFSGSRRDSPSFRSPGNVLFMQFIALKNAKTVGFDIYFEQKPIPVHCQSNQITCRNGIKCVELKQYCDGVDDCEDGTDEEKCPKTLNDLKFQNGCGHPIITPVDNSMRIVGGTAAKPGSWPWMVDMRLDDDEPYAHTCGAAVLNRQWVITAAHCFNANKKPNEWRVYFAKYQKLVSDSTQVLRYIDNIYIHPDYRGGQTPDPNSTWFDRVSNDIALVRLNAPLPDGRPFISSICLPEINKELKPKDMVWVTGWGNTLFTGNELVLKQTKVPIISNEMCRQWMPEYNIGSTQICAGFEEGGQDSCQGDSGGPLVRLNTNTTNYELLGIVSTGGVCAGKKQAGIYTKVSHYISWIDNTLTKHKLFELRLFETLMKEWQTFKKQNF